MFNEIGTPSGLGLRRDERERERVLEQQCEHTIPGRLECACDRGSNDENLLQIGLQKLIFQSQGFTAFLRP